MSDSNLVTSPQDWRAPYVEGTPVQLPSGKVMRLRPVTMASFLTSGKVKIPDSLSGLVDEIMTTGGLVDEKKYLNQFDIKSQQEYYGFVDDIVMSVILSPKVVKDLEPKGEDEVSIHWIDEIDKQWIIQFFNTPATALESFRYPKVSYVDVIQSMQGVPSEPESGIGDKPIGEGITGESSPESS